MSECELCGRSPATVEVTEVVNGSKREVRLCASCAEEPSAVESYLNKTPIESHVPADPVASFPPPVALSSAEVEKILGAQESKGEAPTAARGLARGDRVRIKEGPFEGLEGSVDEVFSESGRVRVILSLFGHRTPVDLGARQVVKI